MAVVASHRCGPISMVRYSDLLRRGYELNPNVVASAFSPSALRRRPSSLTARKYLAYLEQLVFAVSLIVKVRGKFDIVHVADHSDAFLLLVVGFGCKRVVTCHDLFAVRAARGEIPEYYPGLLGRCYQRLVVWGLACADLVLSVSTVTSNDIADIVGTKRTVAVIPNPVDFTFEQFRDSHKGGNGGNSDFALVVGSADWRKRRGLALEVWSQLRSTMRWPDLEMVVVGPCLVHEEIEVLERYGVPIAKVSILSSVTDVELAELYRGAAALIQMSKYEGFCWPVAEANYIGLRCVCADEEILRETGPSNIFVKSVVGTDWAEVADALRGDCRGRLESTATSMELFSRSLAKAIGIV